MHESKILSAYAAYSKDIEVRLRSSSGGVFSLIAEYILSMNGVVYGVSMSNDCKLAEFIRVKDIKELHKLRGSKYLQAKIGNTYENVRKDLFDKKRVLFSGTPCQINGLKKYLVSEYSNLVCVDIICHGVPSPALWKKYVEYKEEKNTTKLVDINFRSKENSWINYGMKEVDSENNHVYSSKDINPYMKMFLKDYCLRPSCYNCKAKEENKSDITIADFWGIDKIASEMNDNKGVSLLIVRTGFGSDLFTKIQSSMFYKSVSYEDGVRYNKSEYKSVSKPPERDLFFNDMRIMNFNQLSNKYICNYTISIKTYMKKFLRVLRLKYYINKLLTIKLSVLNKQ